ncbi:hypothetical protein TRIUR3_08089 [Triticum urartu]|uniref:Crossover junction endonuclease EME1 n=1 Tax=Triticum urartu TaxID=4572 RepID=M7ZNI6_TRIUA|nr:hypothetical protein TRIUR3_08089 [Triticum urartu]
MEENAPPIKERKGQKRLNKEEKDKMIEEKKRQREEKRLEKEANKIQQAEKKKSAKEKAEWASGKRALESIVAKIDSKVIETGSIGESKASIRIPTVLIDGNVHLWNRKQLSWLSVQTNGVIVPNDFVNKDQLKKDTWFMSLLAIPKVKPRLALAIWKKYGTMRSLLNVYMDPNKSVLITRFMYQNREKELLLKDLKYEDSLGEESKKVGPVYSRRVYRMLMAENGAMEAEEAVKS